MFTSLNERILQFGLLATERTFSGDFTTPRGLFIICIYLPFYIIFQLYAILFFSDDLIDKVVFDNYFDKNEQVVKTLNRERRVSSKPKSKKSFKIFYFLLKILRICGKWIKQVPVICLVVGLIQMMEREVTLDSVTNIDFKIIERSIEGRDLSVKRDVEIIKNTINELIHYSGRTLFPLAILTPKGCLENGSTERLCKRYALEKDFSNEILQGDISKSYGVSMLISPAGKTYMFSKLSDGQGTLIGEAGAYSSSTWGRAAFIDKIPYYLSRSGLKKMYSKSKYIWLVISLTAFVFIVTKEIAIARNRRRWQAARIQLFEKDLKVRKALEDLNEARMQSQIIGAELEQQKRSTESLKQEYIEKLDQALVRESESEAAYFELLESYEEQELIAKKLDTKPAQRKEALEKTMEELTKIKRLWTHDYSWNERFDIEKEITSAGNSPFIRNISFIGFERFIKKLAQQKLSYSWSELKSHDGPTVIDLIDQLEVANMISKKDKNFFHEVRIARNSWIHEGKLPNEELLKRLVAKLDNVKPKPQPTL